MSLRRGPLSTGPFLAYLQQCSSFCHCSVKPRFVVCQPFSINSLLLFFFLSTQRVYTLSGKHGTRLLDFPFLDRYGVSKNQYGKIIIFLDLFPIPKSKCFVLHSICPLVPNVLPSFLPFLPSVIPPAPESFNISFFP